MKTKTQTKSPTIPAAAIPGHIRQLRSRAVSFFSDAALRKMVTGKLPAPKSEPHMRAYLATLFLSTR